MQIIVQTKKTAITSRNGCIPLN